MTGIDIDIRTDVYSLGVLLYELLIGARPFDLRGADRASTKCAGGSADEAQHPDLGS